MSDAIPIKIDQRSIPNAKRAALGLPLMGRPVGTRGKRDAREPPMVIDETPPEDRLRDQLQGLFSRVLGALERWKLGDQ